MLTLQAPGYDFRNEYYYSLLVLPFIFQLSEFKIYFFRLVLFLTKLKEMHFKYSLFRQTSTQIYWQIQGFAWQHMRRKQIIYLTVGPGRPDWFWQQKSQQIWVSALAEIFCHRGRNMRQNLAELDLGAQFRLKYEAGLRLQYERKWK